MKKRLGPPKKIHKNEKKINPINPTLEWINSIPKIINDNGCWIPSEKNPSDSRGYTRISISNTEVYLHRLSMCLYYNINYFDYKIETRHGVLCNKSCFNYEHLKPGTTSDNELDKIRKDDCPKCGYSYKTTRSGIRYCNECRKRKRRKVKI